MQLRWKFILFTTVPLLGALSLVAATMQHQTLKLAGQERQLVESAYVASKETELRHYVQMAGSAIAQIAQSDQPETAQQRQALAVLTGMKFGDDGYFFVYDRKGTVLLDASQMGQAGVDLCDPNLPGGEVPARLILAKAGEGGGFVRYPWQKPSTRQTVPKLAFVSVVPAWGWTLGTGLYLDDVEDALAKIEAVAQDNIRATRSRIYAIAALCMVLIGIAGLVLNISDHRVASAKLRRLARRVVHSQEEERVRVARELHDGVVQVLVSSKYLFETAQIGLPAPAAGPARLLDQGLRRLNDALVEIRRVSHGLRPALLDDLGLAPALALMAEQADGAGCAVVFHAEGTAATLPTAHSTALFRVAQEAVTNARQHGRATRIDVALRFGPRRVRLLVRDDGSGFALRKVQSDGQCGIGLRNMRERIESLHGVFLLASGRRGTTVRADLPLPEGAGAVAAPVADAPPDVSPRAGAGGLAAAGAVA
ncbi:cache domain-containing protein [uncultured Xylophilus sp.]|uniref:cache domain-containing protein n=1 Tax=uncultured Xylophilus sp. TaxID=296832 RepID=UPI0025F5291A|nr:cache domain-containing protein [uncultured Xylophilus sp.]